MAPPAGCSTHTPLVRLHQCWKAGWGGPLSCPLPTTCTLVMEPTNQDPLSPPASCSLSPSPPAPPDNGRLLLPSWQHRQLLKDSFMVELVEGARKLRHVFLFTDLFLCAKLKKQMGG